METDWAKKDSVGIIVLLCAALALVIIAGQPGFTAPKVVPATVGNECRLDTPQNPHVEIQAGVKYIVSAAWMWCLGTRQVEAAHTALVVDPVRYYPGKTEAFTANPGQRYKLAVAMPCSGTYRGISAKTLFWWDNFHYVYNTSGPVTLGC